MGKGAGRARPDRLRREGEGPWGVRDLLPAPHRVSDTPSPGEGGPGGLGRGAAPKYSAGEAYLKALDIAIALREAYNTFISEVLPEAAKIVPEESRELMYLIEKALELLREILIPSLLARG